LEYKPYKPRSIISLDTRFIEALSPRIHAERIQKYLCRNMMVDWTRKFAKYIVLKARRTRSAIALEDPGKLWFNVSRRPFSLADKLSRFEYRKLQYAVIARAIEYNVPCSIH